jgi:DNA repair exonuclease SbcCD ATPase subunit
MKKVIFNSIKIQNFLSIGDKPLEIKFQKGINLITGENKDIGGKNGIGKSTIADALYWCLFGNTLRDLKKEKIQHNQNNKECNVVIKFDIHTEKNKKSYEINRVLNPSKITIISDGKDETPSTLPKSDEYIKNLIGANEEVFNNAVIMSSNNTLPFMAQKKVDKRKFIEGILQLNVFGEMLLKTRSDFNECKKQNDLLSNNFINHQKNLEMLEKLKNNDESNKKNKIKELQQKIEINQKQINKLENETTKSGNNLKNEIAELNEKLKFLEKFYKTQHTDISNKTKEKIKIESSIDQKNKEKQKILSKGNICPTCNREYCKEDINHIQQSVKTIEIEIKNLQKDLQELNNQIESLQEKLKEIEDGIKKIQNKQKKTNEEITSLRLKEQNIQTLKKQNTDYKKDINKIEIEKSNFDSDIKKCKKDIDNTQSELENIKNKLKVLNTAKYIVSEEGIKTYIVKKLIDVFNQRLNFYLKKLQAPCKCEFDELFEETIFNDKGKECSYFNFSGGERKRIDIAILFMFQDILRLHTGTSFSLNFYDELFDSAIDDNGIEKIIEILKNKVEKYEESVYIISHKNHTKVNVDNVLLLEKSKGVTSLLS